MPGLDLMDNKIVRKQLKKFKDSPMDLRIIIDEIE